MWLWTSGWGQTHFTGEIRHNCSTVRVISQWNRLPWEAADFPFLQVFTSGLDAFVENTFNKHEILGSTLANSVKSVVLIKQEVKLDHIIPFLLLKNQ